MNYEHMLGHGHKCEFLKFENGLLWYWAREWTNAGGCEESYFFPVTPESGRTYESEMSLDSLRKDFISASISNVIKRRTFAS